MDESLELRLGGTKKPHLPTKKPKKTAKHNTSVSLYPKVKALPA